MRVIRVFMKEEIGPGKYRSLLFSTYIKLAIEFDWKGHCPYIISNNTTPNDQISALFE